MGAWISNLSLKYKFWAVNAVAFVISLMLVLFALQTEQQARSGDARQAAIEQARLLQQWPAQATFSYCRATVCRARKAPRTPAAGRHWHTMPGSPTRP